MAFRFIASTPSKARAELSCLTLTCFLMYLFNAIHARPAELSWDKQLLHCVLPHGSRHQGNRLHNQLFDPPSASTEVPLIERGALWCPPIHWPMDPVVGNNMRFDAATRQFGIADEEVIGGWLAGKTMNQIKDALRLAVIENGNILGLTEARSVRPARATKLRRIDTGGVRNHMLEAADAVVDDGPNVAPEERIPAEPQEAVDAANVFIRIIVAVMQTIGPSSQGGKRFNIPRSDRWKIGLVTLQDLHLSLYFSEFEYKKRKGGRSDDWERTRNLLFPVPSVTAPAHLTGTRKTWKNMAPWADHIEWQMEMCRTGRKAHADAVHRYDFTTFAHRETSNPERSRTLLGLFDQCEWFPSAQKERPTDAGCHTGLDWVHKKGKSNLMVTLVLNPRSTKPVLPGRGNGFTFDPNANGWQGDEDDDDNDDEDHVNAQPGFDQAAMRLRRQNDRERQEDINMAAPANDNYPEEIIQRVIQNGRRPRAQYAPRPRVGNKRTRDSDSEEND